MQFLSANLEDLTGLPQVVTADEDSPVRQSLMMFIDRLLDSENLIVLAGSGTSLSLNVDQNVAPSMWDLWLRCSQDNPQLFAEILALVGYDQLQEKKEADGKASADIELLLSICDSLLQVGRFSPADKAKLTAFLSRAKDLILESTSFTDKVNEQNWSAHNKFIRVLGRRGPKQQRLKLFTTNYDLAFETACTNTGFTVIDGFEFSNPSYFNPMWFQYDVVTRGSAESKATSFLPNLIHLYKLHGSIDWRYVNNRVKKTINPAEGNPLFIYPSSTKYQSSYDYPYLEMISAFLTSVQKPKTAVLCLGFGFNDKHINNSLILALRTNPDLMLMVSTKDPFKQDGSFNPEMRNILTQAIKAGDGRIGIVDSLFSDFVNLIPNRRIPSPEADLFNAFEKAISSKSAGA